MSATTQSRPWERLERGNVGSQASLVELVRPQTGERVLDWDEAVAHSALREVAARLPDDRVAELRRRLEEHFAAWRERPTSYVLVVGSRR